MRSARTGDVAWSPSRYSRAVGSVGAYPIPIENSQIVPALNVAAGAAHPASLVLIRFLLIRPPWLLHPHEAETGTVVTGVGASGAAT